MATSSERCASDLLRVQQFQVLCRSVVGFGGYLRARHSRNLDLRRGPQLEESGGKSPHGGNVHELLPARSYLEKCSQPWAASAWRWPPVSASHRRLPGIISPIRLTRTPAMLAGTGLRGRAVKSNS